MNWNFKIISKYSNIPNQFSIWNCKKDISIEDLVGLNHVKEPKNSIIQNHFQHLLKWKKISTWFLLIFKSILNLLNNFQIKKNIIYFTAIMITAQDIFFNIYLNNLHNLQKKVITQKLYLYKLYETILFFLDKNNMRLNHWDNKKVITL